MNRRYGLIEADTKLRDVINVLNAKERISLWSLEKYEDNFETVKPKSLSINDVSYVYQLYEGKEDIMDYVVDYIRFDFDGMIIVIKPNKWM